MSLLARLQGWASALRRDWKSHLGTVALCVGVLLAVQLWQTRQVAGGPLPDAALDAELPVLDASGALRQSSLRTELAALQQRHPGKNVGIYIWADWCPICTTIQGTVNGVAQDHPVITVAMQSGPPAKVGGYLASRGLAWHTVVDGRSAISGALGFGAVPAFAVITPEGQLRWPTVGLTSGWGMRARLLLAG
jgi:hypothetical protein